MRRLVLALGLICAAVPARAVEIVVNYTTQAGLVGLATQLGYYDPVAKTITAQGKIAAGGSYFFNNVGPVVATPATYDNSTFPPTQLTAPVMAPGLWARLRHNGDPASLASQIPSAAVLASFGVTVYRWTPALNAGAGCWSSDGATCGPAYVATIGLIQ